MRKKFIASLMVIGVIAVALCGCGENGKSSPSIKDDTVVTNDESDESQISSIQVGSIVTLGAYEQDGNVSNGEEPIEWKVLAIEDGKALVISKYVLEWKQYHEESAEIRWAESGLRIWLNNSFYSSAFNADESERIVPTSIAEDGEETTDYVFILNKTELEKYFPSDNDRISEPTTVVKDSANVTDNIDFENAEGCWYWICSGGKRDTASYITKKGKFGNESDGVECYSGVRPAMWITINE